MRQRGMLVGLAVTAVAVTALAAQQEMQSRPGPGSGVMDVRVVNHPSVVAAQGGEWLVSIGNTPNVRIANVPQVTVAGMPFLRMGSSYVITWPDGSTEKVTVREVGPAGWVRASADGVRWLNLATARAVDEAR